MTSISKGITFCHLFLSSPYLWDVHFWTFCPKLYKQNEPNLKPGKITEGVENPSAAEAHLLYSLNELFDCIAVYFSWLSVQGAERAKRF